MIPHSNSEGGGGCTCADLYVACMGSVACLYADMSTWHVFNMPVSHTVIRWKGTLSFQEPKRAGF